MCHATALSIVSNLSNLISVPLRQSDLPRKRVGRVGEMDDNSSCCITSFLVTRICRTLAPQSASSRSQQRDDFTVHMHMKPQVPAEDRPMQQQQQ